MRLIATAIVFAASGLMYGLTAQADRRLHSSEDMSLPIACLAVSGLVFLAVLGHSVLTGKPGDDGN